MSLSLNTKFMFVSAIEKVDQFTRPIHFISRPYKETTVGAGSATLFFVNEEGCAVTCRHVAEMLIRSIAINTEYQNFSGERFKIANQSEKNLLLERLEEKYGYKQGVPVNQEMRFIKCFNDLKDVEITTHPLYDLAIIKFKNAHQRSYGTPAVFIPDNYDVKRGKSLCRLGYPFPEFTNFRYNADIDNIEWTNEGRHETPAFPIDGIITRHLGDEMGNLWGLEMSTPGLRGQSGGPLFDTNGIVYGMQSSTKHLHLGFDMVDFEVSLETHRAKISNHPFLHVGQCVHAHIIKQFLKANNVGYYEANMN
jgi:Trypsin-like peptidase domain